jgi:small multidrug resistance family-3 protein
MTALLVLFLAAILEAGGDALVRSGLRAPTLPIRLALFALGGLVLFSYGYVVNAPPWDFGRLLGIYVVFFFVIAQLISWLVFSQPAEPCGVGRRRLSGGRRRDHVGLVELTHYPQQMVNRSGRTPRRT